MPKGGPRAQGAGVLGVAASDDTKTLERVKPFFSDEKPGLCSTSGDSGKSISESLARANKNSTSSRHAAAAGLGPRAAPGTPLPVGNGHGQSLLICEQPRPRAGSYDSYKIHHDTVFTGVGWVQIYVCSIGRPHAHRAKWKS